MPAETAIRETGRCEIAPDAAEWLASLGLCNGKDFLDLPGVVVSGHVGRNVSRVRLGDVVAYLKREHRIRKRDRFRSLLAGFRSVSLSEREAVVLNRLRQHDLPAARPLAWGEADGQGFLLVEEAEGAIGLREHVLGAELAERLGCVIADIHNAGIDQPDLFAKHFLVNPETNELTILDWQRACLCRRVSPRRRIRSLAALRATLPADSCPDASWTRLLEAYASSCQPAAQARANRLPLLALRAGVEREAKRLSPRPGIRSQLAPVATDQELVRIGGETVCAIPEVARELEHPEVIESLYDPANQGRSFRFRNGRTARLRVSRVALPFARWWAAIRGKSWRSPELKTARLLFHLERFGIPGPRMLAYGQKSDGVATSGAFVLIEECDWDPPAKEDSEQLHSLLKRLHQVGCQLFSPTAFGTIAGRAAVRSVDALRLNRRLTPRQMERDHALLDAFVRGLR
jgi:tRNA A-37 threonylcarbamoyl transferase component Bud32